MSLLTRALPRANACPEQHIDSYSDKFHAFTLLGCNDKVEDFYGDTAHSSIVRVNTPNTKFLSETIETSKSVHGTRLVHIPGLSENVVHPFARERLDGVFSGLPVDRAIAQGHNGVGLGLWQFRDKEARQQVAATRLQILHDTTKKGERLLLIGSSMGSIVLVDMVEMNFNSRDKLDIAGIVLFGPALHTDPGHAREHAVSFGKQLTRDAGRDFVTKSPRKLIRGAKDLVSWGADTAKSLPHIYHQLGEIITASDIRTLHNIFEIVPAITVHGNKDDIVAHELWNTMAKAHPKKFSQIILPGKGHEILVDPDYAVAVLVSAITQSRMLNRT